MNKHNTCRVLLQNFILLSIPGRFCATRVLLCELHFVADDGRSVPGVVSHSVLWSEVMRVLLDCIRTSVLYDTYRGVCRLSHYSYDVEPYFVPTAMAERRKQQGKPRHGVLPCRLRTPPFIHCSISLRPACWRRVEGSFPSYCVMCATDLQTICNRGSLLQRQLLRCTAVIQFEDICCLV